jgi:hypothetical protein
VCSCSTESIIELGLPIGANTGTRPYVGFRHPDRAFSVDQRFCNAMDHQRTTFDVQYEYVVCGQLLTLTISDFSATDNF